MSGAADWVALGRAHSARGEHERAALCFARALSRDRSCTAAWHNKGASLLALGVLSDALECFDRAIALDGKSAPQWIGRGEAQLALGNDSLALYSFGQALELDGKSAAALAGRARALERQGRGSNSHSAWRACLDAARGIPGLEALAAEAAGRLGLVVAAERGLLTATPAAPDATPESDARSSSPAPAGSALAAAPARPSATAKAAEAPDAARRSSAPLAAWTVWAVASIVTAFGTLGTSRAPAERTLFPSERVSEPPRAVSRVFGDSARSPGRRVGARVERATRVTPAPRSDGVDRRTAPTTRDASPLAGSATHLRSAPTGEPARAAGSRFSSPEPSTRDRAPMSGTTASPGSGAAAGRDPSSRTSSRDSAPVTPHPGSTRTRTTPAEPTTAAEAVLQLSVSPGAAVSVDGVARGTRQQLVDTLSAGRPHLLRFERDGYAPLETLIVLRPGSPTRIRILLTRQPEGL